MRAVVIDDNINACADLRNRLKEYEGMEVVGEAYNGFDGINLIATARPDVVFLDVELPDISGMDFISRSAYLRQSGCKVVVYTAFEQYVIPALRSHVHDILLKPIDKADLDGVVGRLAQSTTGGGKNCIEKKEDGRFVIFTNSLDFTIVGRGDIGLFVFDSKQRCWSAVLAGMDHPVRLRGKINSKFITGLGDRFVQVHQKYIINVDYLINVVDGKCCFFPPFDKVDYVTVGRVYREKLLDRFLSL